MPSQKGGPSQQQSAPSSGTRSITSQRSQGSGGLGSVLSEDSTRFSMKEFKAVTGGTPGTAAVGGASSYGQGIAYETKVLTPDGFDAAARTGTGSLMSRASPEELTQQSPDSLLSAQLLRTANWQDILKQALASDLLDDTVLNDEERIEAETLYNDAHSGVVGGEPELEVVDTELVDRIRGVKDKAEGRAVHLNELLGIMHEKEKIKTRQEQGSTPGLPPIPATTSSQKRRTLRQQTPAYERVTYSDFMKSNGKNREAAEGVEDISILTSPTMSQQGASPRGAADSSSSPHRSPSRETPLHKAHTSSSSVKATPEVPHESLVTGNTSSGGGGQPFRPSGLGANGSFISNNVTPRSSGSAALGLGGSGTTAGTPGGVRAYSREQEQAIKLQALTHRVEHMSEQIARLERAILLVLDKHPMESPLHRWTVAASYRVRIALADTHAAFTFILYSLVRGIITAVSLLALYVVFFRGLKLVLFAATTYPLPNTTIGPILNTLEGLMGSPWNRWDEYTLPLRLLQLYQGLLYPRFGYMGLCTAQRWVTDALLLDGALFGECLLPSPPPSSAGAAGAGWFS